MTRLQKLLREAAERGPMTAEEIRAQKISFIYGQLMDCNPDVTKEQIARIVDGE